MYKFCFLLFSFLIISTSSESFSDVYFQETENDNILEIPFEYVEGLIVIKATVNGEEGRFLFDNGATHSCFNKDFAKKSNVTFRKRTRITDGNNNRTYVRKANIKKIEIDKAIFSNTEAYLIDTKKFFPCDPVDGIIGASIINAVNWKIDFEKKKMLLSLKPFEGNGLKMKMDISSSSNSTFINFKLNKKPLRTKVDFGFKGELKVNRYKKRFSLRGIKTERRVGISSLSITGLGNIDTTRIIHRDFDLSHLEKQLPVSPEVTLTKYLKYDARIGLDYFKKYKLIVNSTSREYILSNPKPVSDQPLKSYGIKIYVTNGAYKIIQIKTNESFSSSVKLMSEITFIDGKPVTYFKGFCHFQNYLDQKKRNRESLSIRLKNSDKDIEIPFKKPLLKLVS
ncbi:hypothetical protein GTQ40_12930 [Flavobacteriaceae bacterium R38]|nr:hypothetical protein [Flavobacteriaceae bacterium R38]